MNRVSTICYNLPGKYHGQIYSYPEKRWKKKKHYFLFSEEKPVKASDIETGESGECLFKHGTVQSSYNTPQYNTVWIYSKTCVKRPLSKKKTKNWFSRPIIA